MGRGSNKESEARNNTQSRQLKMWLDDLRTPPDESWTWVKTMPEAQRLLQSGSVSHASLDNDLGEDESGNNLIEGRKLVLWMAETNNWPSQGLSIHSSNVVAVEYMSGMIKRYGPYELLARGSKGPEFSRSESSSSE